MVCQTKLSCWTIGRILHDHLKMSKVRERWVSTDYDLRDEGRKETMFHRVFETFSINFQLVTVDKTWVYLYDPEMKYQSIELKLSKEPSPKKTKASRLSRPFSPSFGMPKASYQLTFCLQAQILLLGSNKVSETRIGKEKTEKITKSTCHSPPTTNF